MPGASIMCTNLTLRAYCHPKEDGAVEQTKNNRQIEICLLHAIQKMYKSNAGYRFLTGFAPGHRGSCQFHPVGMGMV
jgi:hypothetical protein